jgi:hypothetical protein
LDAANERISAAAAPSLPAVEAQAEAVAV